jgi:hypothetical protein
VGSVLDLLKHIPEAAKSPLAFVAYCLVTAAWVLNQWFATKPQRNAKAILKSFKDDKARLAALGEIFNEPPPHGLTGNQAILEWVKARSSDKSRVLLVVAWLATLVAVLIFLVAVKNVRTNARQISIRFHRITGTPSACELPLPLNARVVIQLNSRKQELDIVDCTAKLPVAQSESGRATLSLINSDPYEPFDPRHEYDPAANEWDVPIRGPLQVTLFNYSGLCPDLSQAFDTFAHLVRYKANSLRGMFSPDDKRFDYLSRLSVVRTGRELIENNEEVHNYWQQTGSLQLLAGLCMSSQNGEVMRSQIFFGNLKGKLPSESLQADLPVSANELGNTRDLYTAAMLYALAQEARNRQLQQDLIIAYLGEAETIVHEVDSISGKQLRHAINESLKEANAPKPMEITK